MDQYASRLNGFVFNSGSIKILSNCSRTDHLFIIVKLERFYAGYLFLSSIYNRGKKGFNLRRGNLKDPQNEQAFSEQSGGDDSAIFNFFFFLNTRLTYARVELSC